MKTLFGLLIGLASFATWAQQTGSFAHPFQNRSLNRVGVETGGYLNDGAGAGLQARYVRGNPSGWNLEAGVGAFGGERSSRMFLGAGHDLIKEDINIPRVMFKTGWETYQTPNGRRVSLGAGPLMTKGYALEGTEVYPFINLPMRLVMEPDDNSYVWATDLSVGSSAELKINSQKILATIEANFALQNTASGIMVGVATDI